MKIYHGTNIEFGAIDLNLCPPDRDFGQGFYCTNIKKAVYDSDIFTQLSDETTKFYLQDWTEIYELLKNELKRVHDKFPIFTFTVVDSP